MYIYVYMYIYIYICIENINGKCPSLYRCELFQTEKVYQQWNGSPSGLSTPSILRHKSKFVKFQSSVTYWYHQLEINNFACEIPISAAEIHLLPLGFLAHGGSPGQVLYERQASYRPPWRSVPERSEV